MLLDALNLLARDMTAHPYLTTLALVAGAALAVSPIMLLAWWNERRYQRETLRRLLAQPRSIHDWRQWRKPGIR